MKSSNQVMEEETIKLSNNTERIANALEKLVKILSEDSKPKIKKTPKEQSEINLYPPTSGEPTKDSALRSLINMLDE